MNHRNPPSIQSTVHGHILREKVRVSAAQRGLRSAAQMVRPVEALQLKGRFFSHLVLVSVTVSGSRSARAITSRR